MGLIETTISAASSSARRGIFSCDTLSDNVLLAVGRRPAEPSGGNSIDHGDKLKVAEGQCALLVSKGKVTDFCAIPGMYTFNMRRAAEPMLGPLEEQAAETWKRLLPSSGDYEARQLYYVNLRSVPGPAFEAETPFFLRLPAEGPLGDVSLNVDVDLVCSGRFTYRVCDPILFYTNVTGNVKDCYFNTELNEQLRKELILQLQTVLAKISAEGRTFPHRAAFCQAITEGIERELTVFWPGLRGIALNTVTISNVYAQDMGGELLARWLAVGGKAAEKDAVPKRWFCPDCGTASTGNFCPQCGRKKPEDR